MSIPESLRAEHDEEVKKCNAKSINDAVAGAQVAMNNVAKLIERMDRLETIVRELKQDNARLNESYQEARKSFGELKASLKGNE